MEQVSRRLGVTIRLDIRDIELLESLAQGERIRPAKKAENIVLEYLTSHQVNTHD
ncbi:hypothetical protein KAW18_11600 [candidate division WOR-3 bacterium]|nr:hypothetical protein [candidate division WOR-3 bacterium]